MENRPGELRMLLRGSGGKHIRPAKAAAVEAVQDERHSAGTDTEAGQAEAACSRTIPEEE